MNVGKQKSSTATDVVLSSYQRLNFNLLSETEPNSSIYIQYQ